MRGVESNPEASFPARVTLLIIDAGYAEFNILYHQLKH